MEFKAMLTDAMRYSVSKWYNILILGLILFLTDHIIDFNVPSMIGGMGDVLIVIIIIILSFLEIGYGFRIVEETVQGSSKPPNFHHPLSLIGHGVRESVILLIYFIFPLILIVIGISEFETMFNLDFSPMLDYALFIAIMLFVCFNILFQGAVLNMAHHEGSLRSGFNMIMVFRKIRQVGLKNMLMISFITVAVIYILQQAIFDTLHGLPFVGTTVGDVLSTVLIAPFLILFTTRLLGLIDVTD
ncbi:DUF4013 domain-containing protein [uncultured Methanobacterium sp.]|uniref:DUF4013 domain-containing protein n=1 Tax=uncultured Methanobacterium sp. TaxID=176306 RepID=UPI002AA76EB7|nr:DUF4013 domain-containing protein [uncultured Methanobacterium sp.]